MADFKEATVKLYKGFSKKLLLPISCKEFINEWDNIKLLPYSMYPELVEKNFFNSEDAETVYDPKCDSFIIFYNDLDEVKIECNRFRYSIAHEMGHIALGHLDDEKTRISRNGLSKDVYEKYEWEAERFASYFLAPFPAIEKAIHINLIKEEPFELDLKRFIKDICQISDRAAEINAKYYDKWSKGFYRDELDDYIRDRFNVRAYERLCVTCKSKHPNDEAFEYCPICGAWGLMVKFVLEEDFMEYDKIELNNKNKALKCPVCNNTNVVEGDYCQICGNNIVNRCTNMGDANNQECGILSFEDARFCHLCGAPTTFYKYGYLKSHENKTYEEVK